MLYLLIVQQLWHPWILLLLCKTFAKSTCCRNDFNICMWWHWYLKIMVICETNNNRIANDHWFIIILPVRDLPKVIIILLLSTYKKFWNNMKIIGNPRRMVDLICLTPLEMVVVLLTKSNFHWKWYQLYLGLLFRNCFW